MGVFARFRRKSKDTEKASTAEAASGTLTAEPEAAGESPEPETGKDDAKAEAAADEAPTAATEAEKQAEKEAGGKADAEAEKQAEAEPETVTEDTSDDTEAAAADNVDIPKQQSAEKAADNDEADEGARK
ncbi:hypothetical protein [Streptomyces sp. NPDC051218]|uniref:hypothetical protein n=1 Tax=Streptomyces sp. NPDC051218 TaxID=3365645 RepID=UPI0037A074E8